MPEYLTPGVYVEETSFRSRSIEGVPTSTFAMAGRTAYGPVPYILPGGPTVLPGPALVTSFTEYERAFGGLKIGEDDCQLALAARAFFANGGQPALRVPGLPVRAYECRRGRTARRRRQLRLPGRPRAGHPAAVLAGPLAGLGGRQDLRRGDVPARQEHPRRRHGDGTPRLTGVQQGAAVEVVQLSGGAVPSPPTTHRRCPTRSGPSSGAPTESSDI